MSRGKSRATDPDFVGTEAALRRAAQRARLVARQAGTPIVVWRDGHVVKEYADVDAVAEDDTAYPQDGPEQGMPPSGGLSS